jgi:hypothetical protein
MPSSARIAKPAWIQSSMDNRLLVSVWALAMSGSLRPVTRPKTNADVTLDLSQENDSQRQSGFLTCWSHVLLHTHTTEIFSVRSTAEPAQSSGRDSAVKKSLRCRMAIS